MSSIQCVLFDLGGVLIELDGPPVSSGGQLSEPEIWQRWLVSSAVREYESGRCDLQQFASQLIHEMELKLSNEEFVAQFERWPKGLYPGVIELLETLKPRVHVACLSNTNALHWQRFDRESQLAGLFDTVLASFLTGRMKPDADTYRHAVEVIGFAESEILFLDDNASNIAAAREHGLKAELTRGPGQAEQHLKQYGLL